MRHIRKKNYSKYMLMSSYFYTHISYLLNFNTNNVVSFDTKYQWPEPSMPFSTHRVIETWNLQSLNAQSPKVIVVGYVVYTNNTILEYKVDGQDKHVTIRLFFYLLTFIYRIDLLKILACETRQMTLLKR